MWMTLLKWGLRIAVSWIVPVVMALFIAPKGKWAPGMNFGTWFKQSGGCDINNVACDVTQSDFCWGCEFFGKLIDFFSMAIEKSFTFLATDLILLILFGTAIWFAWFTFSQMKIDGKGDGTAFVKKIIRRLGRVAIILFIFGGISGIAGDNWMAKTVGGVVKPIFLIHTSIVEKILNIPEGFCPKTDTNATGILSGDIKNSLMCTMGVMSLMTKGGMQAGGNMMFFAELTSQKDFAVLGWGESRLSWLGGAYLYGAFLLFHIMIPFLLLDILLTIIIPLFFFPLILAGYAFQGTEVEGHLKTAINMIVKSAFKMIAISVAFVFIYSIYIAIGDKYYPKPVDNFSYIFPNYLERKKESHTPSQIEIEYKKCYASVENYYEKGGFINTAVGKQKLLSCAKKLPNLQNSNGWIGFLLLIGLIQITLKLFMKIKDHISGLIDGNELNIGTKIYDQGKSLGQKGIGIVKNFAMKKLK